MTGKKTNVSVDIDSEVVALVAKLLERAGLDQTTAIDMFFRQIIAERGLPFQPAMESVLDEQIINAIWKSKPEMVEVEVDDDGNILIDRDKHPDLYDWAVNG